MHSPRKEGVLLHVPLVWRPQGPKGDRGGRVTYATLLENLLPLFTSKPVIFLYSPDMIVSVNVCLGPLCVKIPLGAFSAERKRMRMTWDMSGLLSMVEL